jgi:simple sugar transport system ATP-binding protein
MSTPLGPPPQSDGGVPPSLLLSGITRRFGDMVALDDAQLVIRPGTVHALLGENGAGKTTLMRVAFGLLAPDTGTMQRNGRPFRPRSPVDAIAAGIGMVFQHFSLVPAMTVAENIALGGHGRFDPAAAADRVRALADRTGLAIDPALRIADATLGLQQRCEILKALARDSTLLMLDEPTAVLAPADAAELLQWIRRFADAGHAVVLVTHRLRDALAISDDVTVLRRGRTVRSAPASTLSEEMLAAAMIGDAVDREGEVRPPTRRPTSSAVEAPVLRLEDATLADGNGTTRLRGVTMRVHAGELVGIAGIEGQGQQELLRVLAGRAEPLAGRVERPATIGFVPEDRLRDAVLLDATLTENLALRGAATRSGRLRWQAIAADTRAAMAAFDVRAADERVTMRTLSGGNQQKFVLARELADRPAALVVENPTRGLDIRASAAVRRALHAACAEGTAVVCYSSDLDEVLAIADRVLVVTDGQVVEVPLEREAIAQAMVARTDRTRGAA